MTEISPAHPNLDSVMKSPELHSTRWYAVMTHPHSEQMAERHLTRQCFHTYLPFRLKTTKHARRFETKRAAYFSRYLFVALDIHRQRWRAVNSTLGVSGLVMCGNYPLPISNGVIEAMISVTGEDGVLRPSDLVPGQKIRVTTGAFLHQLGTLDRVDGDGAVRILLEIMSRHVPVRLFKDQIVAVS